MKKIVFSLAVLILLSGVFLFFLARNYTPASPSKTQEEVPNIFVRFPELLQWKRPEGPPRIALQVGHYKNEDLPEELERIKSNGGASAAGVEEWEVNLKVASNTASILKKEGYSVDILPATVPPSYWADVFVAIHADGSDDEEKSGFKVAGPWRDITGKSEEFSRVIEDRFDERTTLAKDGNITRNMRGYYAFSWWRFKHAIHPMTTAVILEAGFLTNPSDRDFLLNSTLAEEVLADAIINFVEQNIET